MRRRAKLILEDGTEQTGVLVGAERAAIGEVVFTTGMAGYQEVLTDPSYCGQIVTMTYPMIGNYGVCDLFNQARKSFVRGYVIDELCDTPSNWRSQGDLEAYLKENDIPCLTGIDTRAITRKIRVQGTMRGVIAPEGEEEKARALIAGYEEHNQVAQVTTPETYVMDNDGPHVVVLDMGIKRNILLSMHNMGFKLTVMPAFTKAEEIKALNPDGLFFSNGPGDPKDVPETIETIRQLVGYKPMFGICLGHQLLCLALGGDTYKMKFGHRGVNHPVKDFALDRVFITSQNHGYAVDEASLAGTDLEVTHRAVNDNTVEGLRHTKLPIFSVQYHPEAAPGPDDNIYLFKQFEKLMGGC